MKMKKHLDAAVDAVKDELFGVLIFVAVIWAAFVLDLILSVVIDFEMNQWIDLNPRQLGGLVGVVTMPLAHNGWVHIISNTIPLIVLLTLLAGTRAKSWFVVGLIVVLGGTMTWIIGNSAKSHVGASGLVFGLITFLIATGIFEKRPIPLAISILVGLLFGTSLLRGLVPLFPGKESISWSGHWCGAIAGIIVAYLLTQKRQDASRKPVAREIAPSKVSI